MDEFDYVFVLSLLAWPVLFLLSGRVWHSLVASGLAYLAYIWLTMVVEDTDNV